MATRVFTEKFGQSGASFDGHLEKRLGEGNDLIGYSVTSDPHMGLTHHLVWEYDGLTLAEEAEAAGVKATADQAEPPKNDVFISQPETIEVPQPTTDAQAKPQDVPPVIVTKKDGVSGSIVDQLSEPETTQ